jgi:hypothetical protein
MEFDLSHWIYDIETYPNCFTFSIQRSDGSMLKCFEVSSRKNEIGKVFKCLDYLNANSHWMVGFNNKGFDYPVLHKLIEIRDDLPKTGRGLASKMYRFAMEQIASGKDGFAHTVPINEEYVRQIDLFKIHHFDNKAKATSLKMIEFNMRSASIEDLPFPVGIDLEESDMDVLCKYNMHDVKMTRDFYLASLPAIVFRTQLSAKYGMDFTNHNDTKIGKDYFIMELEKNIPGSCYKYKNGKRQLNQTKRPVIKIKDCLFDYYNFKRPEFKAVLQWFSEQRISETKGVFSDIEEHNLGDVAKYAELVVKKARFKGKPSDLDLKKFKKDHPLGWVEEEELKAMEWLFDEHGEHVTENVVDDKGKVKVKKVRVQKKSYWGCWREAETLNVVVDGFRFDFGTGGIHGSLTSKVAKQTSKYFIIDADVSSMYPNIAISNDVYPEHLSGQFCVIYTDVYNQRKSHAKGTAENGMLKLALNGVYGDSNNKFSPFFDPQYTMKITINGQLSLCLLAEQLLVIPGLKLIQVNTDGVTVACLHEQRSAYEEVCVKWQKQVKLDLEYAEYSKMFIRDVNNYIAVYTNGKVKRKGAYQYEDLGWHQNQSALVIPKAAEAYMVHGTPLESFVMSHKDEFDFMLRTKVPRSSKLVLVKADGAEIQQQNICRYYPSTDPENSGKLVKLMPALETSDDPDDPADRRLSIDKEWNVKICNDMQNFSWDLDYDYYIAEAKKLCIE